jgi:hypothetical protein
MKNFMLSISLVLIFISSSYSDTPELTWPREIDTKQGVVTLYQPQLDSFREDTLEGRMAISIKPPDDDMIFCAAWFKAQMSTDVDERVVTLNTINIERVHFPDIDDQKKIDEFKQLLSEEIESWDVEMSLDRLLASLNEVEDLKNLSVQLNNDPPDIYFRTSPTILVSIDGNPILKKVENSDLEYVVNTPFFIMKEQNKNLHYLKGGKFWYVSDAVLSGWTDTDKVPSSIEQFANENMEEGELDSISASYTEAPVLIVVAKPAELVITDGDPDYGTIEGTSLLYATNSESDILMDITSQEHYILLAGRWYRSKSLKDGEWKFAEPEDLPADFAKIPEDSDISSVRANIPGTPEAQDAILEHSIPQTATVDRKEAKVEVTYDGNPEFKKVEGTEVYFAANTDKTVLRIKNKYYCVDEAIWFVSDRATGPWEVSDVRPDEVDELPPSSDVYNVKYVYIYDSTPEVVYVGYLPGYTYSYVYEGVVVYGTGYWYHPWYRAYYYPRPVTWGFGVHWNRFHPYRGWWGPRGYHHGYRHGYRRGYRHGARSGYRAGYRAGQRNANRNVYRNRSSGVKQTGSINRAQANRNMSTKTRASTKPNNMYADKNGNIHQRNTNGSWEQRSNKKTTQTPKQRATTSQRQSTNKQLENSAQGRSRGNSNYNRSKSSRSSSGSRSGGGRIDCNFYKKGDNDVAVLPNNLLYHHSVNRIKSISSTSVCNPG